MNLEREVLIILIIFFVISLFLIVLLIRVQISSKNKYTLVRKTKRYEQDRILSERNNNGSLERIYEVTGSAKEVIDKYQITKIDNHTSLIFNIKKQVTGLCYKVFVYNKYYNLIDVLLVQEKGQTKQSSLIKLGVNAYLINVEIEDRLNNIDDYNQWKKGRKFAQKQISFISSYALFFLAFPICFLLMGYISRNQVVTYFNTTNILMILAWLILICIVNFILVYRSLSKRMPTVKGIKK